MGRARLRINKPLNTPVITMVSHNTHLAVETNAKRLFKILRRNPFKVGQAALYKVGPRHKYIHVPVLPGGPQLVKLKEGEKEEKGRNYM